MNPIYQNSTRLRISAAFLFSFIFALISSPATAQTFTPTHTFTIATNTTTETISGSGLEGSYILTDGKLGIAMNNNAIFRIFEPNGTVVRTLNMVSIAGSAPQHIVPLYNDRLLIVVNNGFLICDLQGSIVTSWRSTGMVTYNGTGYLHGVALSNGDIAFAMYASDASNQIRVFHQDGTPVTGIINAKTTGTGIPSPAGNQFYSGKLTANNNGTFLFVYETYYAGSWGILFNNDGTMRTWPSTGLNHYMVYPPSGNNYYQITDLVDGSYLIQHWLTGAGNRLISGTGTILSTNIPRSTKWTGSIAVNRKATAGSYVHITTEESIAQNYDGSDDFVGVGGIYAAKHNLNGTLQTPLTQIGSGNYNMVYYEDWMDYYPAVSPAVFAISSINGSSGGYGVITQNYSMDGSSWNLTVNLYEVGLSTLPIKLESFSGLRQSTGNLLKWTSSSEINASRFEVEYSPDGIIFSKLGSIAAMGGTSARSYSFNHTVAGTAYYRLKLVDQDGTFEYSKIIKLTDNLAEVKNLKLYPVPAIGYVWVEASGASFNKQYPYTLVSAAGVTVLSGNIAREKQKISLEGVRPGIYYLNVAQHAGQKLIVK